MTVRKTLDDWLIFYEKLHAVGIDLGLSRVQKVWKTLCETYHIQRIAKRVITVAGTNGKGSTCQMLSCLLQQPDKKVAVYSSPHIHRFNERIKINDKEVSDKLIIRAFEAIEKARGETTLSYFEATTLACLLIFAWECVDEAILEVGLGGRLDAVNIIDADAVIITSIAQDHENFLGTDLSKIALEKVGVCRPQAPTVYAQAKIYDSVIAFADKLNTPLLVNQRDYQIIDSCDGNSYSVRFQGSDYSLPEEIVYLGQHQIQNAAAVLVLLARLVCLPKNYTACLSRFSLAGRLQKIGECPDVIVDVAHNEEAAQALAAFVLQQRKKNQYKNYYAVMGMLKDKAHDKVFAALDGVFDGFYFAGTSGERGLCAEEIKRIYDGQVLVQKAPATSYESLKKALEKAKEAADDDDVVYAFGSFLVVEELT